TNRCFPFWEDFQQCYFSSTEKTRADCVPARDDYLECLHHFKEIARDDKSTVERVHKLEANVLNSHQNLNDIVEIYTIAQSMNAEAAFTAVNSLGRIYSAMWTKGLLKRTKGPQQDAAAAKVSEWLRDNYRQYTDLLRSMLGHREAPIQVTSLRLYLQMMDKEGQALGRAANNYVFPNDSYLEIIETVLNSDATSEHLVRTLVDSYLNS
ncbi:Maturation and nuclear export of 40S ribosomal subunits interacting protein, partial [Coemansia sp. RSA 921]